MSAHQTERLIIDGYSLLHRDPEIKPLLDKNPTLARQLLIRKVQHVTDHHWACPITIVFDGKDPSGASEYAEPPMEVIFAPAHLSADTVIERLVFAHQDPGSLLVVTSDRLIRQAVEAAGAQSMACGDFLSRAQTRANVSASVRRRPALSGRRLGDYFPS